MKNTILLSFFLFYSLLAQELSDGFILYTPFNISDSTHMITYLVDQDLNEINRWNHDYEAIPASMPYLMQDSTIWYPSKVSQPLMASGGVGGRIQKLDWNDNILWDYTISNDSLQHHHDIEPLPNGNILVIAWERKTLQEALDMGREIIESPLQQMWSEAIFEIEPVGNDSANIVWEWHLWDHLIQDVNPSLSNYGIIEEHPELLDINLGSIGFGPALDNADWIHFNSIHYNEGLEQIILSSRMMSEIYIIDHSSTTEEAASHLGGNYGKGGDFLYRWGNPQNYIRSSNYPQILNSQHSANWIDIGYPGEGNILIFNNFHYNNNSAVIEISPPIQAEGDPYGPESWEWMFYNNDVLGGQIAQSGVFRLYNGNTYITTFSDAKMTEVDYNGTVLFEFGLPDLNAKINRAKKYPPNYLLNQFIGDLNHDELINILDIILLAEIIVNEQEFEILADINNDGIIDVLDIINLINIILEN